MFTDIIAKITWPVIAVGLAVTFYEGVPGVNSIPYIDRVPLIGTFGVGRVEIKRREGVAQERAAWEAANAKLTAEIAALVARKEEEIAEIERKYLLEWAGRAALSLQTDNLQEIIDDLEARREDGVCGDVPAFPKRLSIGIDAVGRSPVAGR